MKSSPTGRTPASSRTAASASAASSACSPREGVEVTGYLSEDGNRKRKAEVEEEKKRILETVKKEQTPPGASQGDPEPSRIPGEPCPPRRRTIPGGGPAPVASPARGAAGRQRVRRGLHRARSASGRARSSPWRHWRTIRCCMTAVVGWIGERIEIDPPLRFAGKGAQILIIVGPTGVGKTTTIAKLAAIYGIGRRAAAAAAGAHHHHRQLPHRRQAADRDVRGDHAHPGEPRGERRGPPEEPCPLPGHGADPVDTIGRSPRDLAKLAEMKEILAACGSQAARLPRPGRHDQGERHGGDPPAVRALRLSRCDPHQAGRDDADRQHYFLPFASPETRRVSLRRSGRAAGSRGGHRRAAPDEHGRVPDRQGGAGEAVRPWEGWRRPRGRTGRHGGRLSQRGRQRPSGLDRMVAARTSPRAAAAGGPEMADQAEKLRELVGERRVLARRASEKSAADGGGSKGHAHHRRVQRQRRGRQDKHRHQSGPRLRAGRQEGHRHGRRPRPGERERRARRHSPLQPLPPHPQAEDPLRDPRGHKLRDPDHRRRIGIFQDRQPQSKRSGGISSRSWPRCRTPTC